MCFLFRLLLTYHILLAEDDCVIRCQHWESSHRPQKLDQEKGKLYPVLLLNGYSTESYCLPTETNDLVRTLLKDGHDVLSLQTRLHPSSSSNSFSIDDIGRVDIPAGKFKSIFIFVSLVFLLPQVNNFFSNEQDDRVVWRLHKSAHSCTLCGRSSHSYLTYGRPYISKAYSFPILYQFFHVL